MITYPTNKLQKVLLGGVTEQRNLPSGHQQLDYLQGDGTAYIETDVVPTNNTGMKIVFEYASSGTGAISGVYDSVQPRQDTFFISTNSGSIDTSVIFTAHRGTTLYTSAAYTEVPVQGKTYTITINYKNSGTMGIEGFNQTDVGTNNLLSNKVLLFARLHYNNDSIIASFSKIKYVEFTEGTEVIRKYYPDRYNNELGLYDTITNTFLTNKNSTGSFTAGAEVATPSPDTPMDIVCNNGIVKVSPNLFNGQFDTGWGIYSSTGAIVSTAGRKSFYIKVDPTKTYTISRSAVGSSIYFYYGTYAQQPYSNNQQCVSYGNMGTSNLTGTITVPTGANYLAFFFGTGESLNVQVELGSTATTYMPYGQIYADGTQEVVTDNLGNTATAERLLAVGDYKDKQEVLSGSVTRNVGIKVLDGTEDWQNHGTYSNVKMLYTTGSYTGAPKAITSTHYVGTSEPNASMPVNSAKLSRPSSSDVNGTVYIKTDNLTLEEFKQFLADQYNAGTPVIVVYPLATPTTEQVTPQPLTGNSVTQTAGSIDNLPIESSTIAELKKRYIGDNEVKRVYIGENLVWKNN